MFIDEAIITIEGGDGGNGKVAFFANKKGPCGGDGGRGGDLYLIVNANIRDLKKFTQIDAFKAGNGQPGGSNRRTGAKGKDLYLQVPQNTTIIDNKNHVKTTLTIKDSHLMACCGGKGGLGNDNFKTSTNQTPHKATPGQKGEKKVIHLVIRIIADVGLIGLPNAGKSSLLNMLTSANVKTADYPFTTLEPNLGSCEGKILADIPGLIEGASTGKGLGIKFLKHIEKVGLLLICIAIDSKDIGKNYETVVGEISKYNKDILTKESVILLTKTDLVGQKEISQAMKILKSFNNRIIPVSVYQPSTLAAIRQIL